MGIRLSPRKFVYVAVAVVSIALPVASCTSGLPDGAEGSITPQPGECSTPNDGCPCGPNGTVVPCGKVHHKDANGYTVCISGDRTCIGGRWGACETSGEVKEQTFTVGSGMGQEPPSGIKTMAFGVPIDCTGTTGLGVSLCGGGPNDGKKCGKPPNCPGGTCSPGHCHGGANDRGACTTLADCPGGTQCHVNGDGRCVGGTKAGDGCKNSCPLGTCTQFAGICDKGANDDKGCNVAANCPGGTCDISEKGLCVGGLKDGKACKDKCGAGQCSPGKCQGGPNDKNACFTDLECIGGICKYGNGKCVGGASNGTDCDNECPLGACSLGKCQGGINNGAGCYTDIECPGGLCKIGDGKCIGGTNAGGGCKTSCPGGSCFMPSSTSFSNPCDPYCSQYVDTPIGEEIDGGVITPGGGLTIGPPDAGDGGAFSFQTTAAGIVTCGGAINIIGPGCTPPGLSTCQQDFRCDPGTNTCIWNGGPGYYDPTVAGVDLVVGAPCGPSGSAAATAPVCNRGNATLPAGSPITFHITPPPTIPNGCSNLGPPTISTVTTGDLVPGQCTSFNIGNSTGNKFITVNAGAPGAVTEAPGYCANNSAAYKDDGAPGCAACVGCNTQVTGKVYDPSGAPPTAGANNIPLTGVTVFQPSGALTPLPDGIACDTCASLASPSQTSTVTDATGAFTLNNVSPGTNIPIVVQSGRWRRQVRINVPNACGVNSPVAGTFRMPQAQTDFPVGGNANIPKMAMVTGNQETLACLMRKIGVQGSQFKGRGTAGTARIEILTNGGMNTSPAGPNISALYSAAVLNEYTAVIIDCDGTFGSAATPAQAATIANYANIGGRVFMDHVPGEYLIKTNTTGAFDTTSTWTNISGAPSGSPARGFIPTPTPVQVQFRDWLTAVGASTTYGNNWIQSGTPRDHALIPAGLPGVVTWVQGQTSNNWGAGAPPGNPTLASNYALSYSFETPVGGGNCGVPTGTGRVIYNGMHVSPARGTSGTFPGACSLAAGLTEEEKALEYQLFQLTACQLGGGAPPLPPPPPPPLPTITLIRDYQGVCGPGQRPLWAPFYWEAVVPPGTSLQFDAGTAATQAGLPPTRTFPGVKGIGTGNATVLPPVWACDGCPLTPVAVDTHLRNDAPPPNSVSQEWLRVFMTFQPLGTVAPTMLAWRQTYSCVPAE